MRLMLACERVSSVRSTHRLNLSSHPRWKGELEVVYRNDLDEAEVAIVLGWRPLKIGMCEFASVLVGVRLHVERLIACGKLPNFHRCVLLARQSQVVDISSEIKLGSSSVGSARC